MSLAISSLNAQAPKTPGDVAGSKADAASAKGFSKLFSVLQGEQSPPQQAIRPAGEEAEAADDESTSADFTQFAGGAMADSSTEDGTALPTAAETGKDLPLPLPVSGQVSSASAKLGATSEASVSDDTAPKGGEKGDLAMLKSPALPGSPAVSAESNPGPRSGNLGPSAGSSSPAPTAAALPGMRSGGHPAGPETDGGEGRSQGGSQQNADARQGALSVSLRVTPAASETVNLETTHQPHITRPIADLGIVATGAADGPAPGGAIVQASGEQSGTLSHASALAPKMPQLAEAQDIARIVDRLATAREAVQPASVAMALNHEDFGELSLRFDQLRTGQLSVQLSASNPEAHSALAAAAGQQGAQASMTDSSAGAQTQQNQQGQNAGRGAQAERDAQSGSGQSERGERQKQGGNAQRQDTPPRQSPRDGVFA